MLDFPNLSESSFSDDIEVVEVIFLNFQSLSHLNSIFHKFAAFLYKLMAGKSLLVIFFLLLVSKVFGILKFKSSFFLCVYHKIVAHFMIDVVHI